MRPQPRAAAVALLLTALALSPACRTPADATRDALREDELDVPRSRLFAGLGWRGYDDSWSPFDDQVAFLLHGQHHWSGSPVGLEWGFGFASDEADVGGDRLLSSSVDLSLGPTRTFRLDDAGRFFANVGAGVQLSFLSEEQAFFPFEDEQDEWLAGYAHLSLFWRAGWNWDIGVDLRWMRGGDVDLVGGPRDGEALQVLLGTGFAW